MTDFRCLTETASYLWGSNEHSTMVSEDDHVYVRVAGSVYSLGDGFDSAAAVESRIEERFDAGEYEYGVFDALGSHTVPKPEPKTKTLTDNEKQRRAAIGERAANDDRVASFDAADTPRTRMASLYTHRVRYDDGEVDFSMKIENDVFNSVPVSTIDPSIEAELRGIFNDAAQDEATFLGYESSYASRGRRNPFIRVYGRVHRDNAKETQLRDIVSSGHVAGLYWSEENISAVRIGVEEPQDENYRANDYIVVLNAKNDTDDIDELGENAEERAMEAVEHIETSYDYRVPWVGVVAYNREYRHVCLGITYTGDEA